MKIKFLSSYDRIKTLIGLMLENNNKVPKNLSETILPLKINSENIAKTKVADLKNDVFEKQKGGK